MPRGVFLNLTGQRFGSWKVLYRIDGTRKGRVLWLCICDCGGTGAVHGHNLTTGRSTRCRSCASSGKRTRRKARDETPVHLVQQSGTPVR